MWSVAITVTAALGLAENVICSPIFASIRQTSAVPDRALLRQCMHEDSSYQLNHRHNDHLRSGGSSDLYDTLIYVDRESGKYFDRERRPAAKSLLVDMAEGTCERAPFTGFPARKF